MEFSENKNLMYSEGGEKKENENNNNKQKTRSNT